MINVKLATTASLVEYFNAHSDKPVKKFADRKTAERRVNELMVTQHFAVPTREEARACKDLASAIPPNALCERNPERLSLNELMVRDGAIAAKHSASWSKPEVAAARATRDKVMVDGVEYKSVAAAFRALNLPMSKHIAVRLDVKRNGKAEFEGRKFRIAAFEGSRVDGRKAGA